MAGFPNLGYIRISKGVHLRLAIEGKICLCSYIIYFQIFIHISVNIIFKNHHVLIVKYICHVLIVKYSMTSHE